MCHIHLYTLLVDGKEGLIKDCTVARLIYPLTCSDAAVTSLGISGLTLTATIKLSRLFPAESIFLNHNWEWVGLTPNKPVPGGPHPHQARITHVWSLVGAGHGDKVSDCAIRAPQDIKQFIKIPRILRTCLIYITGTARVYALRGIPELELCLHYVALLDALLRSLA